MKQSLELDLSGKFTPSQLKEFANAIPDNCHISTNVTITPKDRPWDSEIRSVILRAEWPVGK